MCFSFVVICMAVLVYTVSATERSSSRWSFRRHSTSSTSRTPPRRASLTQQTMEKGLLYSGAMVLTYLPSVISELSPAGSTQILQILNTLVMPSQGTFNMLIYTADSWLPVFKQFVSCAYCTFPSSQRSTPSEGSAELAGGELDPEDVGKNHSSTCST